MTENEKTIPGMFDARTQRYGDRAVCKVKRGLTYQDISWRELNAQVEELALGLLDLGVKPGDRLAILAGNRPEWAAADLAILSVGGVTVPIYTSLTPEEIEYILRHAQTHVVFVADPELMSKVLPYQESLDLKIILFDAPYRASGPRIWWIGEFIGLGRTAGPALRRMLPERRGAIGPNDLASIIYTSGTTGPPKGAMLTHDNFLSNCRAIAQIVPMGSEDLTLSFLPLSHVFERTAGYYFVLFQGGTIAYAENQESVPRNLLEVRPTVVTAVPRFYEKIYEQIETNIRSASKLKQKIFAWALEVGRKRTQRFLDGLPIAPTLAGAYVAADLVAFSKLRERLGGRLRFFVSGGAPLSKPLAEFFYAAGILVLEGYGLTETSPVITVNRPGQFRFGSVGPHIPDVELRIAEDGEILTRGPHVMQGYFQNEEATRSAIDAEGWFRTGDIGSLSPEGFLTITDRKKDLIKTSGGKMVAPQNLEAKLKADPYIADCVVIGDRHKYLVALVVANFAKLENLACHLSIPAVNLKDLLEHPGILEFMDKRLAQINKELAPFEQIRKIALLQEPFSQLGRELTPTLKVRRRVVAERYADRIEALYQD